MKKILSLSLAVILTLTSCLYAAEIPEVTKIRWARANSGNVLVTLAQNNGYLKESYLGNRAASCCGLQPR